MDQEACISLLSLLILSATMDKCLPSEGLSFPIITIPALIQHLLCAGHWALPTCSHFILATSLSGIAIFTSIS